MSLINGVDNQTRFFPININQENGASQSITENNPNDTSGVSANNQTDLQTPFQTILESLTGVGTDSAGINIPNALSSLAEMSNNTDNTGLMSVLEQMSKSNSASQDSDQTEGELLNQFLGASASKQVPSQNSAQPITAVSTSQVITTYQQAMREFQKAFNLLSTDNPATTNPSSINVSNIGDSAAISGGVDPSVEVTPQDAVQPGVNPTQQQVISYITDQCRQIGIPVQLGLATAATESGMLQYTKDGTPLQKKNPDSTDWGLMQINDRAWGDAYDFNLIKSDWKYNIRAGLQILKQSFDAALQNNEGNKGANSSLQNLARAAYSGYNAGTGNVWRYRTPVNEAPKTGSYDVIDNEGYDLRDIRFWENYQNFLGTTKRALT